MGHVHPPDRGIDPEPMCAGYDWSTHQANLHDVHEFGMLPPDSGWSVGEAYLCPEPPSFDQLLDDLEQLKAGGIAEGLSPEDTLPQRIATVAIWNLARTDLDHANRCGAAWSVIPTGMQSHKWAFRNNLASVVIYRARCDFFDRNHDVATLSEVLGSCFIPSNNHPFLQRLRFRALLDRREHEQVLKHEAEFRSRNPVDAVHPNGPRSRRKKTAPARKKRR